jgi:hypothetical protein
VAKVVPASALCVPEIRKDVEEGRAVANCCCAWIVALNGITIWK